MRDSERKKQWRAENKDRINAARRARAPTQEQRELARARKAKWKATNPERHKAQRAKDRAIEKEKRRAETGFYERQTRLAERREQRNLIQAERAALASERRSLPWNDPSLTQAEYYRLRYRLDVDYNLRERVRNAMCRRRHGQCANVRLRTSSEPDSLTADYTLEHLKDHIERLFTQGMSWGAYLAGKIEIDHKTPLSHFDLSDERELMQAWALDNLQPLWREENTAKRNRTQAEWEAMRGSRRSLSHQWT